VSNAIEQFSRFANVYDEYNMIQSQVAEHLIEALPLKDYNILIDLGCGSGELYKKIEKSALSYQKLIALDSSENMLNIHPNHHTIEKICSDFNRQEAYKLFPKLDTKSAIISSSALQWSKDLSFTFSQLAQKSSSIYLALFTSNTFKTLHQTANIISPIYDEATLKTSIEQYYRATFKTKSYRLYFDTVWEMLSYIKKSGVSGGERQLSYKQIKKLLTNYPLNYLEFEVLFVKSTSLK